MHSDVQSNLICAIRLHSLIPAPSPRWRARLREVFFKELICNTALARNQKRCLFHQRLSLCATRLHTLIRRLLLHKAEQDCATSCSKSWSVALVLVHGNKAEPSINLSTLVPLQHAALLLFMLFCCQFALRRTKGQPLQDQTPPLHCQHDAQSWTWL